MRLLAIPCALAACGRIGFTVQGAPTGDAPTSDTLPSDTVADTSDAAPVCAALTCDSFDTGIDTGTWTIDVFAGTAAPGGAQVHSGAKSVVLTTNAIASATTNPRATLVRFSPLPLAAPTIYLRAWFYLVSPFDTNAYYAQMLNFANSGGTGISIGARHGVITANDYASLQYAESASAQLPLDRWFCLELAVPNGSTSTVRTYLDGTEVTDIAVTESTAQPVSDHIYVGFEWVGTVTSLPAYSGYIDDVAISDAFIPCN